MVDGLAVEKKLQWSFFNAERAAVSPQGWVRPAGPTDRSRELSRAINARRSHRRAG
jgi:hypothetical protein